jgi:hypothetical protein
MPENGTGISDYLDLVRLTPLLARTRGTPKIKVGLIDGPVVIDHPDLATENIREVPGKFAGCLRSIEQRRLQARDVCCRNTLSKERFSSPLFILQTPFFPCPLLIAVNCTTVLCPMSFSPWCRS